MKKLLLPFLFFLAACSNKENKSQVTKNENTDYLITTEGIGAIKTSMKQAELEKLLNKKITLTNPTDTTSGSWQDSATIRYKEATLKLTFVRSYEYVKTDSFHMRVTALRTESPLCKTISGLSIGSTKQQVIDAYPNNILIMAPDYDNNTDTIPSKTLYAVRVRESWEGPQLIFYLKNKTVYAIEVGNFYDDSE